MDIRDQVALFTRQYHSLLEKHFEEYGRENFPFYGAATTNVQIWRASDGFVTFYLEKPSDAEWPRGYMLYDYSGYTLDTLCAASSIRFLRVSDGDIGKHIFSSIEAPANAQCTPDVGGCLFSEQIREAALAGCLEGIALTGMTISPTVDFKNGVRTAIVPSRAKIWSPTLEIPGKGRVRMYQWTHADFWWLPEQLPLNTSSATELAGNDLIALRTVLQMQGPLTSESAQQDMSAQASLGLERACEEFMSLLNQHGANEEKVHQWLNRPEHHIFLDLAADKAFSKVPFGAKVSDFVVRKSDRTYLLIEIEPAVMRIFQKMNQEPTKEFNHACQQVRDWQRYIRDNVHTVRSEQGFDEIYEPRGMVVMGRTRDIDGDDATIRWRDMKNRHELDLYTYDEIVERVRSLAASLQRFMQSPVG
jgi:hypothetical protein